MSGARAGAWPEVAAAFHARVRESCWDTLVGELLNLHAPAIADGGPVCGGCDRERGDDHAGDPLWPCRTYTLIARRLLHTHVEETLEAMLAMAARRRPPRS